MTKKEKLCYLLKEYKSGRYNLNAFTDEFERIFYYEYEEDSSLDKTDYLLYKEIADVCGRFSPYESDRLKYSTVFIEENKIALIIDEYIKALNL